MTTDRLPTSSDRLFLTDGGLETDLIFNRGIEIPEFAAFVLHDDDGAAPVLREYFSDYLRLADTTGLGLVLDTLTWKASADSGARLGYDRAQLADVNRRSVEFLQLLRDEAGVDHVLVSGCVGPRGDGYSGDTGMSEDDAAAFHEQQIAVLADAGVDFVSVYTLTHTDEAVGAARAAAAVGVPVVLSFTVETDGRLPSGTSLADAVRSVDEATGGVPAYFMINCAHPEHFVDALSGGPWATRIAGVRANASRLSHAELNQREDLDDGDPADFGAQLARLIGEHPQLRVLGGCCGTDARHLAAVAAALR